MKHPAKKNFLSEIMKLVIVIMIIITVLFGVISYFVAKFTAEDSSSDDMNNAASVISSIVYDYMDPKIKETQKIVSDDKITEFINYGGVSVSEKDIVSSPDYKYVMDSLDTLVSSDKDNVSAWLAFDVSGALIGNGGKFLSPDDFSLKDQYWYKKSNMASGTSSQPMCSAITKSVFDDTQEVVTVICPVVEIETTMGYVGLEISVDALNKILGQYTLNSGCYPIVTCNFGTFIYSPSSTEFTDKFNVNRAPLINVLSQAESYQDGIDSFSDGYDTVYFNVDNTSVPGWSIIVLFDNDIMTGGIYKYFKQICVIICCMVILSVILIRNAVNKEAALIPKINETVSGMTEGAYKNTIDTVLSSENELKTIADNVNKISVMLKEKDALIEQYAQNDILTELPNRVSLYNEIENLICNYKKDNEDKHFALMFIDLDNFKWLNETLGHNFGDEVLRTFAEMLSTAVIKYGKVYRFSGDEFILIVEFGSDYGKIYEVIDIMRKAFDKPVRVMSDNIYFKFSVGISIYPDDDEKIDMLLRDADMALHRAKENGKDRVSFYTNVSKKHTFSKASLAQRITTALRDNELYLNYQPIISTATGDIHGFEVLLRWNSAEFGNVPPTEFIQIAEETGAIVQIGTWIFESSCRFLKQLCDNYRDDIIISINVSPVQLKRSDYIEHIKRVIEITQVDTKNIQIEITESTLIDFTDSDNNVIHEINDLGIAIALDDFGTGYSSLNYLKNFPIKCLKIDKSFIDEINNNQRDYAITDSIIDLVHNLGIKTVAEGIETVGQYNFLCNMTCDYIQGFLMSKPLNEEDALEFVKMYDALHKPDSAHLEEHERQLADEREKKAKKADMGGCIEISNASLVDGTISQ